VLFLRHPDAVLGISTMDAAVEAKVRQYLGLLAWSLPASLFYRTFYAFCNALGKPRVLMGIGLFSLGLHAFLAWGLALQGWLGEPLGAVGCALSNVLVAWLACLSGALYLAFGPLGRRYRPFANWALPQWATWRELLRLGVPMGLSNLVEITSFTLISLFVASLGATVVAGHRIVANLSALTYMLPLSLAIATMAALGQAVGAHDRVRARATIRAGLWLAAGSSSLVGLLLWLAAEPVVNAYTDDPGVRLVAVGLSAMSPSINSSMRCRLLPAIACAPIGSPSSPCWCRPSASGGSACWAVAGCAIAHRLRSVSRGSGWPRWSA